MRSKSLVTSLLYRVRGLLDIMNEILTLLLGLASLGTLLIGKEHVLFLITHLDISYRRLRRLVSTHLHNALSLPQ